MRRRRRVPAAATLTAASVDEFSEALGRFFRRAPTDDTIGKGGYWLRRRFHYLWATETARVAEGVFG